MFYASRPDQSTTAPLTETDVTSENAKRFVSDIEQSIAHYSKDTLDFLTNLRRADDEGRALDYISAVATGENAVIAYNLGYANGTYQGEPLSTLTPPSNKLVAFHPSEGVLEHDHPYIQLNWPATEQTAAKTAVAEDFLGYLHWKPQQEKFQQYGFRDFLGNSGASASANGIDQRPSVNRLPMPEGPALDKVLATWREVRKPANVLLLIDTSNSMNDGLNEETRQKCTESPLDSETAQCLTKLKLLKQTWDDIQARFPDEDNVGLWSFSRNWQSRVDIAAMNENGRSDLSTAVENLTAAPGTALYDSIAAAVDTVAATSRVDAINAVVVLSDGHDEDSKITEQQLLDKLKQQPVRVFTIAYGFGSDYDAAGQAALKDIAAASNASSYTVSDQTSPDITDITEELTAAIISNF
jgi:Ca-activated chloride channel family protein